MAPKARALLVAAVIEQAEQHRPQQRQEKHQQSPGGRHLAGCQAHHHQGDEVLDDQHADGDAAMEGAQLALAFQHLGRQHGTGERQGDGQQHRFAPVAVEDQHDGRQHQHAGDQKMQQTAANDFPAHQVAELELEPHGEQQQEHAQVRQVIEDDAVVTGHAHIVARCGKGEAGAQVADQWRQADEAGKQAEAKAKAIQLASITGAASGKGRARHCNGL